MAKFLSDSGLLTLIQKIKEEFDSIYETIIDDEKVTASALIDINNKYNNINNAINTIEGTINNLASVATSGSYNDLSNKPTIPNDSSLVHKTGDEAIGGDKTFTGTITGTDINGDLYGGVYASYAEIREGVIVPPVDGNVGTLVLGSEYAGDAQLIVGNPEGNPDGETSEEQATGGWNQIYNSVTDITLQDELDTKSNKIPIVSHGTSDTTFTLTPNVYHTWGEVSTLTLTLEAGENGYLSEYMFEFQSGNTPTTLTLPNTVEFPSTPTIEANKRYQVSIVSNIGLIVGV